MSAKAKQLIIIYTAAALVTLSVLSAVLYSKLADYRLTALYSSSGAFETTVSAVDGLSRSLKKSLYVTDATLGRSICTQAYANALAAEAALSALPFSTQELEQLSGFLNRAGDYAKSLGAQSGDKLSDEQKQQLKTMSDTAAEFSARLRDMQGRVNSGELIMDSREEQLQNIGIEDTGKLSAELLGYEADFTAPEDFQYDGQYSTRPEKERGKLSEEQARALAAEAVGMEPRELKDEYSYEGEDGRRCYSAGNVLLCVSSRGLESLSQSRLVGSGSISTEQAEEIAQDFLKARGYDSLSLSERGGNGSVASFRFVPVQDGALRVDDYISVSVALDDGSVYSYDATRYSDAVPELDWSCDEETARGSLPDNVSVIGSRKVIVQRPGGEYMACYEFDCTGSEGESLRIYADGSDGRQCRIQLEGV